MDTKSDKLLLAEFALMKLEFALDMARFGMWDLNLETNVVERNLMHDQIFGYHELLPEWSYEIFIEHVHADDREMLDQKFKAVVSNNSIWEFEFRICRADDHHLRWIWARGKMLVIHGSMHMVGLVQDITQRKLLEAALHVSDEKMHLLINAARDYAIYMLDPDGIITTWNAGAEHIKGYTSEEIIGQHFSCFYTENTQRRQHAENILRIAREEGIYHDENWRVRKGGKLFWASVTINPVYDDYHALIGYCKITRDLTENKLTQGLVNIQLHAATVLSEEKQLDQVIISILKIISETLGFEMSEMWMVDQDENIVSYYLSWNELENSSQKLIFNHDHGIPAQILRNKRALWFASLNENETEAGKSVLESLGMNCGVGFPVRHDKRMLGVLVFYGKNLERPDSRYLDVFDLIGSQIGNFINRKNMESKLLYLSEHDILTGLVNRLYAENILKDCINHVERSAELIAFLYLDIDKFKAINDTLGHIAGDEVLKVVAARIKRVTRDKDIVARFGGDEFAIILRDIKSRADVDAIARNILKNVAMPFRVGNDELSLGVSIGISIYPHDGRTIDNLIKTADIALYRVKKSGRNNFLFSSQEFEKI